MKLEPKFPDFEAKPDDLVDEVDKAVEDEKKDEDGVEIRGRNNSVKRRFRSMIERRSMWT